MAKGSSRYRLGPRSQPASHEEKVVLAALRFNNNLPMSCEELAIVKRISRAYVWQVEQNALRKIRRALAIRMGGAIPESEPQ